MARFSRLFASALVLMVLNGAAAQAAPVSVHARQAGRSAGPLAALLQWLDTGLARLAAAWGEEGCEMDPNGRCIDHPASAPVPPDNAGTLGIPPTDEGCGMDPDGRC